MRLFRDLEHTTNKPRTTEVQVETTGAGAWLPSQFRDPYAQSNLSDRKLKHAAAHKPVREYSLGEEIANSVTHALGVLLSLAALPLLIVVSVIDGGGIKLFAALVYGISMTLEYVMSTLYHALTNDTAKRVFKVLDHSCIYLFIAGSYTPFCLVTLLPHNGLLLCIGVWVLAVLGVVVEAFWVFRPRWVSALIYLLLGWCIIGFVPALVEALNPMGLWLLIAGGLCYSVGCVFYVLKKIAYMHSLFHVWVLAGSVCQFLSIIFFVL